MKLAILLALACAIPSRASAEEVIYVEGHHPHVTPPQPTNYEARKTPPYSDAAVLSDTWTTAWFLLDVDERGVAQHYKWLKKPPGSRARRARRDPEARVQAGGRSRRQAAARQHVVEGRVALGVVAAGDHGDAIARVASQGR